MTAPALFPVPRELAGWDDSVQATGATAVRHDPTLPAQGYELRVDREGIRLAHADDAGRRYGEQTLEQLRRPDGTVPGVVVRDWPDVAQRGFMLDVSRDRVPTRAHLDRLVELLARARYNHLQLYIEHAFAYAGHEVVWGDASPITADDLAWLDDRCQAVGIELAANQNCFGHLGPWLRHEPYRSWAECPDGFEAVPGLRFPPTVLAPTAANAEFALGLMREQMASVRSRTVNVGCDETFELGKGASAARAAEEGTATVYLEHLRRIVDPLLAEGCSVQFWGDVLRTHPEQVAALPAGDLTALVWTYEAPRHEPLEVPDGLRQVLEGLGVGLDLTAGFAAHVAPFVDAGGPFWVVPGTSSWNSLVGRLDNARGNLLDAAQVARDAGAAGFLVTDWGDNGHHQPPSVSYPPLAYGGAVAWCAATNHDLDLAAVVDGLVGDGTATVGRALEDLGGLAARTGMTAFNLSPLFAALFPHQRGMAWGDPDPDGVQEVLSTLDRVLADLPRARPEAAGEEPLVKELLVAAGLARHGAVRMAVAAGLQPSDPSAQAADLRDLIERYEAAWRTRSREGGLAQSVRHLQRTLRTYEQ